MNYLTCLMVLNLVTAASLASSQSAASASCDQFLSAPRVVRDQQVGPESCRMQEAEISYQGRSYRRLDLGLSGTVEGYLPKTGYYINYFTSAPDLVFPQGSNPGPIYFGVGRYDRDLGSSLTLIYPSQRSEWNEKLWVTVHGRGRSFKRGNLRAWDQNFDPQDPLGDFDKFERLMVAKGYAVAKTRRSTETLGGELKVTLEDGTFYPEKNLNDNARVILDFTIVAENALKQRLGQAPTHTYQYGHSAGGRLGRSINYVPGLNRGPGGKLLIDGILADDSATGLWLPILIKDGKDVLFADESDRQDFVPQLEVIHQMYNRETPGIRPSWVSSNYLQNKRQNARILRDKGLFDRHRMYEVRSVSHSGGEGLPGETNQILNLSLMMDRFIDILDAWVVEGTKPPPNRSDWVELGDVDGDGVIEHPALSFPEVACPLGVYHQYPPGGGGPGTTFYSVFSGHGLEPLDSRGVFVDMNKNGIWDDRETSTQAWQRLGLLAHGRDLGREDYVGCVRESAEQLYQGGFFSAETVQRYVEQARSANLTPR